MHWLSDNNFNWTIPRISSRWSKIKAVTVKTTCSSFRAMMMIGFKVTLQRLTFPFSPLCGLNLRVLSVNLDKRKGLKAAVTLTACFSALSQEVKTSPAVCKRLSHQNLGKRCRNEEKGLVFELSRWGYTDALFTSRKLSKGMERRMVLIRRRHRGPRTLFNLQLQYRSCQTNDIWSERRMTIQRGIILC